MGDSHQGKDFHDGQRLALPEKYLRHAVASPLLGRVSCPTFVPN